MLSVFPELVALPDVSGEMCLMARSMEFLVLVLEAPPGSNWGLAFPPGALKCICTLGRF